MEDSMNEFKLDPKVASYMRVDEKACFEITFCQSDYFIKEMVEKIEEENDD